MKAAPRACLSLVFLALVFSGCSQSPPAAAPASDLRMVVTPVQGSNTSFSFVIENPSPSKTYTWNFGDGNFATGAAVNHTYNFTNAQVRVTVFGRDGSDQVDFGLYPLGLGTGRNSPPVIHSLPMRRWLRPGETLNLRTHLQDGDNDPVSSTWHIGPFVSPPPPDKSLYTGEILPQASGTHTFQAPGVYYMHCHQHPYMRRTLVVNASAPPVEDATIRFTNFAFAGGPAAIPPGTTIRFENDDPDVHSARLEAYAPGAIVGSGHDINITGLAAGKYQAWITVEDGKGGHAETGLGVFVDPGAPRFEPIHFDRDTPYSALATEPSDTPMDRHETTFTLVNLTEIQATAAFEAVNGAKMRFVLINSAGQDVGSSAASESPVTFRAVPGAGGYTLRLLVQGSEGAETAGVVQNFTEDITGNPLSVSDFGDEGGHVHPV